MRTLQLIRLFAPHHALVVMNEIADARRRGDLMFVHPKTYEEEKKRGGLVWKLIADKITVSPFCRPYTIMITARSDQPETQTEEKENDDDVRAQARDE